jgi:hypothetical protein
MPPWTFANSLLAPPLPIPPTPSKRQKAGADARAAGGGDDQEGGGAGIILKRRGGGGGGGGTTGDLSALRGGVQRLCQAATPLVRNVEFLRGDVESMAKEHRCGARRVWLVLGGVGFYFLGHGC